MNVRLLVLILLFIIIYFLVMMLSLFIFKFPNETELRGQLNQDTHRLHTKYHVDKETFKMHFAYGSIMARRVNDKTDIITEDLVCASELFITSCNNPGMGALLLMTLDHINLCLNIGAKPTIFWRNCNTVCPKDGNINAWEMFFQPVNPNMVETAKTVLCIGDYVGLDEFTWVKTLNLVKDNASLAEHLPKQNLLNLGFRERNQLEGFRGDGVITPEVRNKAHSLLQEYVKVTPKIQKMVDQFYTKHLSDYNVLAVHIRGTDHSSEVEGGKLPPLSTWINNAKRLLQIHPSLNKIFIASDNSESIKRFVQEFGDKVAYTKAFRAKKYNGLNSVHTVGADPYMVGSQVLVDILVMAKCKHFLHAESSVAALVTYFNPNMQSHFLENHETITSTPRVSSSLNSQLKRNSEEELEEETNNAFSCFQQNSRYSACPNMYKGNFVDMKSL